MTTKVDKDNLTDKERKVIDALRENPWGEVVVIMVDGQPNRIDITSKVKL